MITKNEQYTGTLTQHNYYPNGTDDILKIPGVAAGSNVVTSGAIILGDHHTPNPWQYSIEETLNYTGNITTIHDYGSLGLPRFEQTGPTSMGISEPVQLWDRSFVYNAALSKLNGKLRGTLDLAVTLGERAQAANMIKNRLSPKTITHIGRQLQKFLAYRRKVAKWGSNGVDYSDVSQLSWRDGFKIPADLWLEWKYGWVPLVSDVWQAADELTHSIERNLSAQARVVIPFPTEKSVTSPFQEIPAIAKGKGFASCTFNVKLKPEISTEGIQRFSSLNPASIAWELMPYSFVVDWFYDVGSYLRDMETALLYRNAVESCVVSELYIHNYVYTVKGSQNTNGIREEADLIASLNLKKFERSIGAASLIPKAPQFRANLGSSRLFSAAALLSQFLKK